MNRTPSHEHLSAERMQAFLDGELPVGESAFVEEHLAACPRCAAEMDGWRVLFEDLGDLGAPEPAAGFADRVMANVAVPGVGDHVTTESLLDFLDGVLVPRRAQGVEEHLRACRSCTAEADAWLEITRRLESLESFAPSHGFAERVMAAVEMPERAPVLTRIRDRAMALVRTSGPAHVPAGVLQDFVDGALGARAVARVEGHVEGCDRCAGELQGWQTVAARLDTLEHFAPAEGFAPRVMEAFLARRAARAVAPVPLRARVASAAARLVPQTREAWAALSGVALTPAVIVGLVGWVVFSHPTVTLTSLFSFVSWQVVDLAGLFFAGASTFLAQSLDAFGLTSLFGAVASAPMLVAGGVLVYSMMCALAFRVLYKNLYDRRSTRDRYSHVSIAS